MEIAFYLPRLDKNSKEKTDIGKEIGDVFEVFLINAVRKKIMNLKIVCKLFPSKKFW
ncbi:hypothetical protein [Leptospira ognonensis]|uniref:hypothetical protein n=1 Tax=Leptospira ognonensis TaxID=2484945 RepID=UPI00143860D2|nr:hypothetical protein [Leptospira ognonensis]